MSTTETTPVQPGPPPARLDDDQREQLAALLEPYLRRADIVGAEDPDISAAELMFLATGDVLLDVLYAAGLLQFPDGRDLAVLRAQWAATSTALIMLARRRRLTPDVIFGVPEPHQSYLLGQQALREYAEDLYQRHCRARAVIEGMAPYEDATGMSPAYVRDQLAAAMDALNGPDLIDGEPTGRRDRQCRFCEVTESWTPVEALAHEAACGKRPPAATFHLDGTDVRCWPGPGRVPGGRVDLYAEGFAELVPHDTSAAVDPRITGVARRAARPRRPIDGDLLTGWPLEDTYRVVAWEHYDPPAGQRRRWWVAAARELPSPVPPGKEVDVADGAEVEQAPRLVTE